MTAEMIPSNLNRHRIMDGTGDSSFRPGVWKAEKDAAVNQRVEYTDICDWVEVERKLSLAKRKCGLGLITVKLQITGRLIYLLAVFSAMPVSLLTAYALLPSLAFSRIIFTRACLKNRMTCLL